VEFNGRWFRGGFPLPSLLGGLRGCFVEGVPVLVLGLGSSFSTPGGFFLSVFCFFSGGGVFGGFLLVGVFCWFFSPF